MRRTSSRAGRRAQSLACAGVVLGALGFATAAGAAGPPESSSPGGPSDQREVERPRGSYQWLSPSDFALPPANSGPQFATGHTLYLNRCTGGLTIEHGSVNDSVENTSTVAGGVFPEFPYGESSWVEVVEKTRVLFAPYGIRVTDVDPSPAPHDEAVVCGSPQVLGLPVSVGGVAPFRCSGISNAVSFTFAAVYGGDIDEIVAVIGQEAAHAWGLEHLLSCNDPMTYLSSPFGDEGSCWPKAFQDRDALCGEYAPADCQCSDTNTQNSHQHIMEMFGPATPDQTPPRAEIRSPVDGQIFAPGSNFLIEVDVEDDVDVTSVRLFSNGEEIAVDASGTFGPFPAENTPEGVYALQIEAADFSGKTALSEEVTVIVTADAPPTPTQEEPDNAGGPEDELPGGFGSEASTAGGCACNVRGPNIPPVSMLLLVPWLLQGRRRRGAAARS